LGSILLSGGIFARGAIRHEGCENTICFASAFSIVSNQQRGLESTIQQCGGGGGGVGISETYIRACKPRRKPTAYTKSALALAIK
ncbi:hypothetical protein ALC62_08315, partial [Cyphomyrmex costatus]